MVRNKRFTLILHELTELSEWTGNEEVRADSVAILCETVTKELIDLSLWNWPVEIFLYGQKRKKKTLDSSSMSSEVKMKRHKGILVMSSATTPEIEVRINGRGNPFTFHVIFKLGEQSLSSVLQDLIKLGTNLWSTSREKLSFGPCFSIRPSGFNYERPRPPHYSLIWPLWDAILFIDQSYHERGGPRAQLQDVDVICNSVIPQGLSRENNDGLIVIKPASTIPSEEKFNEHCRTLETWLGTVLKLPLDPEFLENGDREVLIFGSKEVEPFTFVDALTGTAFKTVAQVEASCLTSNEFSEITNALNCLKPNFQYLKVIFPNRESAIFNLPALKKMGVAGVTYVGENKRLYEPMV